MIKVPSLRWGDVHAGKRSSSGSTHHLSFGAPFRLLSPSIPFATTKVGDSMQGTAVPTNRRDQRNCLMCFPFASGPIGPGLFPLVLLCSSTFLTGDLIAGEPVPRQFRVWTSPDGRVSDELAIVNYDDKSRIVTFVDQTGKRLRTELTRLSVADQRHILADHAQTDHAQSNAVLVNTTAPQDQQVLMDDQTIEKLGLPQNDQVVYAKPRQSSAAPVQVITMKTVTKEVQVPQVQEYTVLVPELQTTTVMAPVQQRVRCVESYGLFHKRRRIVYRTRTVLRPVTRTQTVMRTETRSRTVMRSETRTVDLPVIRAVQSLKESGGETRREEGIEVPAPLSAGAISSEVVKVFEQVIKELVPPPSAESFNPRGVDASIVDYEQSAPSQGIRYMMRVEINQINPRKIALETGVLDVNNASKSKERNDQLFQTLHGRLTN